MMKLKNFEFMTLFVILETIVLTCAINTLSNETWFYRIILIIMYTLYVIMLSFLLNNMLYEQCIRRINKEVNTFFMFDREKISLKILLLIASLFMFLISVSYDATYIIYSVIFINGYPEQNQPVIFIQNNKVCYTKNYFKNILEVHDIIIVNPEIKLVLENNENVIIKTKNLVELDRLATLINIEKSKGKS